MTTSTYRTVIDLTQSLQPTYAVPTVTDAQHVTLAHMDVMLQTLDYQQQYHTHHHNTTLNTELNSIYNSHTTTSSDSSRDVHSVAGIQHQIDMLVKLNKFLTKMIDSATSITATKHNARSVYQVLTHNTHTSVQHIYVSPAVQRQLIELLQSMKNDVAVHNINVMNVQYLSRVNVDLQQCSSVLSSMIELVEKNVVDVDTVNKYRTTLQEYRDVLQQQVKDSMTV